MPSGVREAIKTRWRRVAASEGIEAASAAADAETRKFLRDRFFMAEELSPMERGARQPNECAPPYRSSLKITLTVVSTSTGWPSS